MRVLVVANRDDADPGFVGERLAEHGAELRYLLRESTDSWPDLSGADLVLVLGSDWSVYWEHVRAEVAAEAALLRAAHVRDLPVFGICYGAQILSHALGGSVRRADWTEIGWVELDTDEPLVVPPGPWFAWHFDTYTVPPGAVELARTGAGPHAFLVGRTFAVQFHPEVDERIVGRWAAGWGKAPLAGLGVDVPALLAETARRAPDARARAHALVDWFCERVA